MNYFTLRALADEWNTMLAGATIADVWSQSANELNLALQKGEEQHTVRIHCDPKLPLLFRADGYARARKNSATLFEEIHGASVTGVRLANRDRFLFVDLKDGSALQIQLFGPRPNVYWAEEGKVLHSFLWSEDWAGEPAPVPRAAPDVDTFEGFQKRWRSDRKTLAQAVAATVPLLGRRLAEEVVHRVGLDPTMPPLEASDEELRGLFDAVGLVSKELREPRPVVYWRESFVEALSLIPLHSADSGWRVEPFDSLDNALGVFSKRSLAQRRFIELFKPVEVALERAFRKQAKSAEAMLSDLAKPSRADDYEAWGHLLMAQAADRPAGLDEIILPDILAGGGAITIKLDPALTAIGNAQRFYAKARQTRAARQHAQNRWEGVHRQAKEAEALLSELRRIRQVVDLEAFLKDRKAALAHFARPGTDGNQPLPYRLFDVHGWEIRVGKSAKSNAALTTKNSGPHDLWLHARGVPGSHVVIRRPNKTADVPKHIIEVAARIAAYFSDAKSQPLAPVIVTERKYVRPVKGGAPGLVRVDREDVVIVEPGLPS